MTVSAYTPSQPSVLSRRVAVVEIKKRWADSWRTTRFLHPKRFARYTLPAKGYAELEWAFGLLKYPDDPANFVRVPAVDLSGWFVRIGVLSQHGAELLWVGRVVDTEVDMHGSDIGVSGDQTIRALGLEHWLDRTPIFTALVESLSVKPWSTGAAKILQYVPSVNYRAEGLGGIAGNRSAEVDGTWGVHVFSEAGELWSNLDYLQYLLALHNPLGVDIQVTGSTELLAGIYEVHEAEGMTTWQMINKLIPRNRGIAGSFRVGANNVVSLHISPAFSGTITAGETTIEGNREVYDLSLGSRGDVSVKLGRVESGRYDSIVVLGNRALTCLTLAVSETTLDSAWRLADEDAYLAAPGGEGAGTEDPAINDLSRTSDKYSRVFSAFEIPEDWDGKVSDFSGTEEAPRYITMPTLDNEGNVDTTTSAHVFLHDTPLERFIPIYKPDTLDLPKPELMQPVIMVGHPDEPGRWIQVDTPPEDYPGAHVRMMDSAPGFLLRSRIPHVFGLDEAASMTAESEIDPVYSWRSILATVALRSGQRLRVIRNITGVQTNPRVLVIRVPDAEFWYVAPFTLIGQGSGGTPEYYDSPEYLGAVVRNDAPKLQFIASLAAAWYGVKRDTAEIKFAVPRRVMEPGSYIRTVANGSAVDTVGTLVTGIVWNIGENEGDTTITTGYMEIDARAWAQFPNIGGPRELAREVKKIEADLHALQGRTKNLPDRLTTGLGGSGTEEGLNWRFVNEA
jgi:hypothetical protein